MPSPLNYKRTKQIIQYEIGFVLSQMNSSHPLGHASVAPASSAPPEHCRAETDDCTYDYDADHPPDDRPEMSGRTIAVKLTQILMEERVIVPVVVQTVPHQ